MNDLISYLTEFIGTFIFMFVIIATGKPILIGLTLIILIYIGGKFSGGAFNPAVSIMLFLNNKITTSSFLIYLAVQFFAAFLAYKIFTIYNPKLNYFPDFKLF